VYNSIDKQRKLVGMPPLKTITEIETDAANDFNGPVSKLVASSSSVLFPQPPQNSQHNTEPSQKPSNGHYSPK